jgi:hypothetical protein
VCLCQRLGLAHFICSSCRVSDLLLCLHTHWQAKWSYVADEIVWDASFEPMVSLQSPATGMQSACPKSFLFPSPGMYGWMFVCSRYLSTAAASARGALDSDDPETEPLLATQGTARSVHAMPHMYMKRPGPCLADTSVRKLWQWLASFNSLWPAILDSAVRGESNSFILIWQCRTGRTASTWWT